MTSQASSVSGIDQLINELKPKSLGRPVRTTIQLPADRLAQDLTPITQAAIKRYCEERFDQPMTDGTALPLTHMKKQLA